MSNPNQHGTQIKDLSVMISSSFLDGYHGEPGQRPANIGCSNFWFIPFPRALVLCEMQSVSSRIWTRVTMSISCDNNHYTTGTFVCNSSHNIRTNKTTTKTRKQMGTKTTVWLFHVTKWWNLTREYLDMAKKESLLKAAQNNIFRTK